MTGAVAAVATRASSDLASRGLLTSTGDPSSSRIVYGIVVALVVIGLALIVVAVWVFRQTRIDPEVLAPLETMSDRRWRRLDPASQRRMLDDERPEGAEPLRPAVSVPVPDEEFAAGTRPVDGFDDLKADPDDAATAGDEVEVAAGRDGAEGVELPAGGEPDAEHAVDAPAEQPSVEPDVDADDEDGSPGAAEETADATSPADDSEVDAVARPDGSDAETDGVTPDGAERIASESVVRAGDATPSAGEEAPSPGVDDSTDGPDRVDG